MGGLEVGEYGCASKGFWSIGIDVAGMVLSTDRVSGTGSIRGRGRAVAVEYKVAQLRVKRGDIGGCYTDRSRYVLSVEMLWRYNLPPIEARWQESFCAKCITRS